MSENTTKILLTPAGIKSGIENAIRLSRDLKNTLNKTQATIHLEIDANGSVINIAVKGNDGKTIGNAGQLAGIGGIRRFVLESNKEAEKESADKSKISVAQKICDVEGVDIKKMRPDANGKVSELIRMTYNAGENKLIAEQWDDEGIEGVTRKYVLKMIDVTIGIMKDEIKDCLRNGRTDKEFLEKELADKKLPKWFFDTITAKNGINTNMQEPMDYLFPKNNFQNGVQLRMKELDDAFLESHWIITRGNEDLVEMLKKLQKEFKEPDGRDAKRIAKSYLENVKVVLKPYLSPMDMIERYKDAKFKGVSQDKMPDGEAGYALKKMVPKLNGIQDAWNEYYRFIMFKETDAASFWSLVVENAAFTAWNMTAQQNTRYWVNELEESDIDIANEWETNFYEYVLNKLGIYSKKEREAFLTKYAMVEYRDEKKKFEYLEQAQKIHGDFDKILADWQKEYNAMPETSQEEKDEKKAFKLRKPVKGPAPKIEDISSWGSNTGTLYIQVPKQSKMLEDIDNKFPTDKSYEKILSLDRDAKMEVDDETMKKFEKYFKGIAGKTAKTGGSIGIVDSLTEASSAFMSELKRNDKYGKVLKPKIENWLVTTFAGSHKLQEIAAEAVVLSIKNQDFFTVDEEE